MLITLQQTPIPLYKEIMEYVDKGLVSYTDHETLPLRIFNYTPEVQFKRLWDHITIHCRSIVYDKETESLVSYAYPKFFNYEELDKVGIDLYLSNLTEHDYILFKEDGSFITAFYYKGQLVVTSKSSFTSKHAIFAQEFLRTKPNLSESYTHLFEYVGPENRIVLTKYKLNELIYLNSVKIVDNVPYYYRIQNTIFKTPKRFNLTRKGLLDIKKYSKPDMEGFVVFISNGINQYYIFKIKTEYYIALHKIVTGEWTPKRLVGLWEQWRNADTAFLEEIPDEWYQELHTKIKEIEFDFQSLCISSAEIIEIMRKKQREGYTRKDIARTMPQFTYWLAYLYDGRDPHDIMLKRFKKQYVDMLEAEKAR